MCIGEEEELQEQNVRLLVHLVNTVSVSIFSQHSVCYWC
jgi:hypothetical protein